MCLSSWTVGAFPHQNCHPRLLPFENILAVHNLYRKWPGTGQWKSSIINDKEQILPKHGGMRRFLDTSQVAWQRSQVVFITIRNSFQCVKSRFPSWFSCQTKLFNRNSQQQFVSWEEGMTLTDTFILLLSYKHHWSEIAVTDSITWVTCSGVFFFCLDSVCLKWDSFYTALCNNKKILSPTLASKVEEGNKSSPHGRHQDKTSQVITKGVKQFLHSIIYFICEGENKILIVLE